MLSKSQLKIIINDIKSVYKRIALKFTYFVQQCFLLFSFFLSIRSYKFINEIKVLGTKPFACQYNL